jgi:hypothetical protein
MTQSYNRLVLKRETRRSAFDRRDIRIVRERLHIGLAMPLTRRARLDQTVKSNYSRHFNRLNAIIIVTDHRGVAMGYWGMGYHRTGARASSYVLY